MVHENRQLNASLRRLLLAAGATLLVTIPAAAQVAVGGAPGRVNRVFLGVGVLVAQPYGEFADYVDVGGGFGGQFLWQLDRNGAIGLRVEAGVVVYGNETKRVPLAGTGGRIQMDVETSNNIGLFGIGPQIMMPSGLIRPYVTGTAGLGYFFTESSVEGTNNSQPFARTTNFDDATFAWTAGGGFYVPVRRGPRPISIDLSARYHGNGRARYLREGSISEDSNGNAQFTPVESRTNLIIYQLGVTVGL